MLCVPTDLCHYLEQKNRTFFMQPEQLHPQPVGRLISQVHCESFLIHEQKPHKYNIYEAIREATTRFELVIRVLQTRALPLG